MSTQYDKENSVVYNPSGFGLKSYPEVAVFKDAADHEFLVKGGIAFRLYIVTDGREPPFLFINGQPFAYYGSGVPEDLIVLEFPRSGADAPRQDTIRVEWAPGGGSAQRVTMVYDKYIK